MREMGSAMFDWKGSVKQYEPLVRVAQSNDNGLAGTIGSWFPGAPEKDNRHPSNQCRNQPPGR
jgi:hypothetical protein